jgi:hypothetical protein
MFFIATEAVLTSRSTIAEMRSGVPENLRSSQQPTVAERGDSPQNAVIRSKTSQYVANRRRRSDLGKKPLKATMVSRSPHEFSKSQQSASSPTTKANEISQ